MTHQDPLQHYLDNLAPGQRKTVDALRQLVRSADRRLVESIKWKAPNFAVDGDDRITLGLGRAGEVRIVLHRGAKPLPSEDFRFEDPERLAKWPEPDRGIIMVRDATDVEQKGAALADLFIRWIAMTCPA